MFERYTERARRALFFARYEAGQVGIHQIEPEHILLGLIRELTAAAQEADLLHHPDIASEHLLLAILREDNSNAASILKKNGVAFEKVRERIAILRSERS